MEKNIILFVMLTMILSGCNTVRGVGEDVERVGVAIEHSTR